MIDTVEIKKDQADKWAREATLESLVKQSGNGNKLLGIIAKAVDPKGDKDYVDKLAKLVSSIDTAAAKGEKDTSDRRQSEQSAADATKDLQQAFKQSSSSFKSLLTTDAGSMFGNLGYAFKDLKYNLSVIDSPLAKFAGAAAIAAEVMQIVWSRGTQMADAVFDMYDAGLVFSGGISQLADDAAATGLDLQTLSKTLTKHGQVVATMGIARTAKLGAAFNIATNGGTDLGMTLEQAQDTLLSYTELQKMSGQLLGASDRDLIEGAKAYGSQLNRLSQVTGQRREQLDQEIKQNLKKPNVNILLDTLNDGLKDNFKKNLSELQVLGPEMASSFQDMIVAAKTGGLPALYATNKNLATMLSQSGQMNNFMELANQSVEGTPEAMDALIKQIGAGTNAYAKNNAYMTQLGGDYADQVNLAESVAMSSRNLSQQNKDTLAALPVPEDAARIKKANQDVTSSLNSLNQAFNVLASKILAPLAGPFAYLIKSVITFAQGPIYLVTKAFDLLGRVITLVTDFFGRMLGKTTDAQGNEVSVADSTIVQGTIGAVVTALIAGPLMMKLIRGTLKGLSAGGGMLKSFMGGGGGILSKLGGGAAQAAESAAGAGGGKGFGTFSKIGNFGSSIAKGFAGLTKGIAEVIETVLTSLARGIKAFGDTQVIKGMLSLGILAADIFIAGKAFQQFSTVNWEDMGKAGVAMVALAGAAALVGRDAAMIALGGISLGAAIGAIGLGMMAAGSGLEKFEKISWETMGKAGVAIAAIGVAASAAGLAAPLIALGGAALGIAIGAIGAGIAGAAWLLGNSLPTLADGIERLAKLDGTGMQQAGRGMESLALGLAAMAAGKITDALGSLGASIINFFTGNDPIKQLKRFGELGEPLSHAAAALKLFADAYPTAVAAINLQIKTGGMLSFIDVIGQFDRAIRTSKLDFDINLLKRFGELIDPLSRITSVMPPFADALEYVSKALSLPIATDGILSLINLITQLDSAIAASSLDFDINELKRFGELVDPLNNSSDAMLKFSDVYAKSFAILNATTFSADALNTLYMLDDIFRDGAFVLMGNWLLGSDAVMIRLASLEPATAYIEDVADRLYYFADAYTYLAEALSIPLLNTVFPAGLDGMGYQRATDATSYSSAFTPSTATNQLQDQSSVNTTTNTAPTKHHHTTQEQRHKEMMDALNTLNDNISSLLAVEDRQTRVMSDGFSKVSGIIH